MASLDIANDGEKNHLIEYQCINFGPYTLQYAPFYFVRDKNGKWEKVKKTSVRFPGRYFPPTPYSAYISEYHSVAVGKEYG